jgi:hypothetical protein
MLSFLQINTAHPLYPEVFQLRETVLRLPLGLSLHNEDLRGDEQDAVFVALDEKGNVVACLMMHDKGAGVLYLTHDQMQQSPRGRYSMVPVCSSFAGQLE